MTVEDFAPAKINLTLHVTGRRDDGYHLLDSLVAFADIGDTVRVAPADSLSLALDGPFGAQVPTGPDNLVLRAARLFGEPRGAAIRLTKRLPVASGVGGGSADAAATIRALSELWDRPWPSEREILSLGADVPVCMVSALTRMRGIGERLNLLGATPEMRILLVNPGIEVPTGTVFSGLSRRDNPPMEDPVICPERTQTGFDAWVQWLSRQRNDLEAPALARFPVIADVLDALRALPGCVLARMSGSGATCFALFPNDRHWDPEAFQAAHPDWWVAGAENLRFHFDPDRPSGISGGRP